ncbi:MAG TPA: sugar phosphate nucleotidyltransferase [Anaerolineales bacterium]|nr:sugar phosphate nucleotidyltransferase [Anaerolineales bacterium]
MSKKAVILSGGLGTRLKPFTEVIPKPLLPIGEKAVMEIQIDRLKKYGFSEVFLATNYKSNYIENFFGDGSRYGVRLTISREETPLGTAGPIKLLKQQLSGEPFVVMNGDILTLADFATIYDFACAQDSMLTVVIKKIVMPYAFGNIHFAGDRVTGIEEKPDMITYALAGIYVMRPDILDLIPDGEYFGMDRLIRRLLDEDRPIFKYELQDYWLDIGRLDDYEKAQNAYKTLYADE